MADLPIGYTTHYNLKKWADGDQPGASALNEDKDLIDTAIFNASQPTTYTGVSPIQINSNEVSLLYRTENLKLSGSSLDTIQGLSANSFPTFSGIKINGNGNITGDLIVGGRLTAEEFYTEYNTSSVIYSSGSTKFGDTSNDTHQFTGSLFISGSVTSVANINAVNGIYSGDITGSNLKLTGNITASNLRLSGAITASSAYLSGDLITSGNAYFGATQFLRLIDTAGGNGYLQFNQVGTIDADTFYFRNKAASLTTMYLANTTGRVGIRTSNPSVSFEVSGSTKFGNLGIESHQFTGSVLVQGTGSFSNTVLLGVTASQTTHAVRADLIITSSIPITGGGNLLSNRTFGLAYNTTNLKITSNELNTIQDIATTSSPQFVNLYLTGQLSSSGTGNNYLIGKTNFGLAKAGAEVINLYGNMVQSGSYSLYNNFSSGWAGSGWRLDQNVSNSGSSKLELDDLTVRGTMNVYQLLINQIRATNGSLFVSSVAKVSASVELPKESDYAENIYFEDPDSFGFCPFIENDIIMIQRTQLSGSVLIKRIIRQVVGVQGTMISASLLAGAPTSTGVIERGDDFVRIGNTTNVSRQGSIYLTSDDSNAPYQDVINNVASWNDWTNKTKLKVRLGNLSGLSSDNFGSLSDYGLYAKGGVYLESSGSQNSIAIKVDSASAQLTMKQSNQTVFDFNTSPAIARIAGWNFTYQKMYANGLANDYLLEMRGSGSFPAIEASAGQGDMMGVLIGRADWAPTEGIGLFGFDNYNGKRFFTLTNLTQSIAGFRFDENKLYNLSASIYRVKLDGTNNLISVNNDKVKMYYTNASTYGISGSGFHLGSYNDIAGWTFTSTEMYVLSASVDAISLNATNKSVGVNNDRVKMYHTSATEYGISGSGFHLGSLNNIAGWTFTTSKLSKYYNDSGYDNIVELNASTTYAGLHIFLDYGAVDTPKMLSVGTIRDYAGVVSPGEYGIQYDEGGSVHFQLTNATKKIAGWTFNASQLYVISASAYAIELNATNKSVGVNSNRVKMYHTSATSYGISGSGFHLGSTNTISNWKFDDKILRAEVDNVYTTGRLITTISPFGQTQSIASGYNIENVMAARAGFSFDYWMWAKALGHISLGQCYSSPHLTGSEVPYTYGIEMVSYNYTTNATDVVFRLAQNITSSAYVCSIANWNFDEKKLWAGTNTTGIVLSTSASAYLSSTGKGFELYNPSDPKLFIGHKTGSYFDWNVTTANTLTISGSITGSKILGSRFATGPFEAWAGENGTYAAIYHTANAPILFMEKYTDANNNCVVNYSPYHTPTSYYLYISEVSASVQLATIRIGAGTTVNTSFIQLDGKHVSKYHGHQDAAPTVNLNAGDTYSSGSGASLKIRMYANSVWTLLN